jgi:hypothetical protein
MRRLLLTAYGAAIGAVAPLGRVGIAPCALVIPTALALCAWKNAQSSPGTGLSPLLWIPLIPFGLAKHSANHLRGLNSS